MILGISTVNNYSPTAVAAAANTTGNDSASPQQLAAVPTANTQLPAVSLATGQRSEVSKAAAYASSDGKTSDPSKQPDSKKAKDIVEQLNKFMGIINTDIKFKLHDKTKEFMVEVLDSKSGKLIRECPSHEFLDMVARLKEYLGALVDKKI